MVGLICSAVSLSRMTVPWFYNPIIVLWIHQFQSNLKSFFFKSTESLLLELLIN